MLGVVYRRKSRQLTSSDVDRVLCLDVMNYRVIKKGRGYVYEHAHRLYIGVKACGWLSSV